MAEFFQVEQDTLVQYVATLRKAQQQLADLPRTLSGSDLHLGNDKLDEAAEEFQDNWQQGSKKLGELVAETTGAVREVQRAYTGTDQAVSDAVTTLKQPLDAVSRQ
jgi:hypothetical protein